MRERARGIGVLLIALASAPSVAAQSAGKPAESKRAEAPITLTGCVEAGAAMGEFTIDDAAVGKYKVSGNRINRFVGRRVEVVGSLDTGRLRVRGGLYPSPNAAGQAGAMDPVKSAIAAQPGGPSAGTGGVQLPELKVKSVKTLTGGCR